jgi:protein SCO1/2
VGGNRRRSSDDLVLVRPLRPGLTALGILLSFAVAVCLLAGCSAVGSTDDAATDDSTEVVGVRGVLVEPEPEVGELALPVAATGEPLSFRAEPGELLLAYFGYTSCPDVCPTTMADLRYVLEDELSPEQADRVQVAMATIDPDRDRAVVLDRYLTSFVPDGLGLRTEDDAALREVTDAFGAVYDVTEALDGEPEVTHSGSVYVIDDEGHVVLQWLFGTPAGDVAHDLELLLDQTPAEPAGTTPEEITS